jgi:myosin heavy subunit
MIIFGSFYKQILMFQPSQLEHLCINLCSETMQHFYNTHIFKSSIESCRDEGIRCDVEVDYVDNVPCIDLVSSLVCFMIHKHDKMTK